MTWAPVFVNGSNPQIRLLAEFLAAMVNTNEEATNRVFGDGVSIQRRNNHWYIRTEKTWQVDAMVAQYIPAVVEESEVARMEMIAEIFEKVGVTLERPDTP